MAVRINFNEGAAQTHTALLRNERSLNKSLLRLSTGNRILNAADDSAGLFIADMLGTVAKGYEQGNRNIQTGISALQIAEASAGQIFDKLQEIYVRAQNAANDINDPTARQALQQEIRNFVEAIQKIGADTEYNGIKLLDGTFKDKYIHYGARLEQTVYLSVDDIRAQKLGAHMVKTSGNKSGGGTNDAITDFTDFVSTTSQNITVGGRVIEATIKNVNGSATNYILDAGYMAEQINEKLNDVGFKAKAINVSVGEKYTGIANVATSATLTFYVGDKSFNFTAETTVSLDELVEKINRAAATANADLTASTDAGRLVLTSSKGYTIGVEINLASGSGVINVNQIINDLSNASSGTVTASNNNATAVAAMKVGDLYIANDKDFSLALGSVSATALGNFEIGSSAGSQFKNLYSIDVTSNEGAEASMLIAEVALRKVDTIRAQIGATMNNLQSIFDSQKVAYDNTKEAESVIRNTDYAKEMAEFTTYQIRMQATVAMLAQANTQPQLVLQLLR
ncbi:flagellin [Thermodesulfobacterium hveragerdense]|uniref:flagellin N-terminal helical domain-containing protein n=1 Tax=Thermodesulfobacterium hveragerdense TaxID=53424 RepID=UPI000491D9E0|nr:flagellin [Thermodesulfobacterium hveragerdense]